MVNDLKCLNKQFIDVLQIFDNNLFACYNEKNPNQKIEA